MEAITAQRILSSVGEVSTNFTSQTELSIYGTPMFIFTLSGSHFDLPNTYGVSVLKISQTPSVLMHILNFFDCVPKKLSKFLKGPKPANLFY